MYTHHFMVLFMRLVQTLTGPADKTTRVGCRS